MKPSYDDGGFIRRGLRKCGEHAQSTDERWAITVDVSMSIDGAIIASKERRYFVLE